VTCRDPGREIAVTEDFPTADARVLTKGFMELEKRGDAESAEKVAELGFLFLRFSPRPQRLSVSFRKRLLAKGLTQSECDALIGQVESVLTTDVHERVSVSWPHVFSTAEVLSAAHGIGTLCRSLDTLHVALAIEHRATEFCTFDLRQAGIAKAAGFTVLP
jgi:predicted nucleic acid-binding protein